MSLCSKAPNGTQMPFLFPVPRPLHRWRRSVRIALQAQGYCASGVHPGLWVEADHMMSCDGIGNAETPTFLPRCSEVLAVTDTESDKDKE